LLTSFDPMSPLPPITTIFMISLPSFLTKAFLRHRSFVFARTGLGGIL
jgi:hypothetical protein